ncbi:Hypothetical protein, putative [Bodo saltans]|uniref:Uncharacterized protein n=1 Tax=Bodo saltans TaxID=75058 RepID=A0A0S4IYK8_BODSA|nr:Hypothetical protein, putative [Bodo saltans]|eukprot:CUG19116.1 Hypothetical protein, putative [Bodo saltans]
MGGVCCCEAPTVVYPHRNANCCIMRPQQSNNAGGRRRQPAAPTTREADHNARVARGGEDHGDTVASMTTKNCVLGGHLMVRHIPIVDATTLHQPPHNPLLPVQRSSSSPTDNPRTTLMPRTTIAPHDSWPRSQHTTSTEDLTPREHASGCDPLRPSMLGSGVSSLVASHFQPMQMLGGPRSVDSVPRATHAASSGDNSGVGSPVFAALPVSLSRAAYTTFSGMSPVALAQHVFERNSFGGGGCTNLGGSAVPIHPCVEFPEDAEADLVPFNVAA